MRIVDVRETTIPIGSPIKNAFIDFSKMNCSMTAVITDFVRDGKNVIGYGFHSNGRYAQSGLMQERFNPRLREADPHSLLNDAGDNLDPGRIWQAMMKNEKPGGHGRALRRGGGHRHGGLGRPLPRSPGSRCFVYWRKHTNAKPIQRCLSTLPAVTTSRARA